MTIQKIKIFKFPFLLDFFSKGHERTKKAKKHIALSFIYKGLDIIAGLALVPVVLTYLDKERYGIWLVFFSITSYFTFLNIGLEQGFRNKFAEALANNDKKRAKYYVSTTYAVIALIISVFFITFILINHFIYWPKILNTSAELAEELRILAIFVFGSFSLMLVLKISTTILVATQKPSILNLKTLIDKLIKLAVIIILLYTTKGTLIKMGIVFSLSPVFTLILISIIIFKGEYKEFRPSFRYIDFSYTSELIQLGYKFFIINIAAVILFATDNMIITQLFGPAQVTPYQIAHKYFSIPIMLFMLMVQPLWSAVTEAYVKKDFSWIKKIILSLNKVWIFFVIGIILMLLISPFFYKVWLGNKVEISFGLSFAWALFIIIQTYNAIYTHFINGVGKLRIQLYVALFSMIANIPLSILLAKNLRLGISGVIIATSISMLISIILKTIQYKKLILNRATGIWNA